MVGLLGVLSNLPGAFIFENSFWIDDSDPLKRNARVLIGLGVSGLVAVRRHHGVADENVVDFVDGFRLFEMRGSGDSFGDEAGEEGHGTEDHGAGRKAEPRLVLKHCE